jgi:hypothetical protein
MLLSGTNVRALWLGLAIAWGALGAPGAALETGHLKVTVQYTGQGTVYAPHEIFLGAFDTPLITNDSVPVASAVITTNGGTAALSGLPARVYLAAAYDEKGEYDGTSGPPPAGTPVMIYGEGGQAKSVPTGGANASVTLTFDGAHRAQ